MSAAFTDLNETIEHEIKTMTSLIQVEFYDIFMFNQKLLHLRNNFAKTWILPMPVAEAGQFYNIFYFTLMYLLIGKSEKSFCIQVTQPY